MWLDNDWKLVQNVSFADGQFIQEPFELYNVIGDPKEEQNLIDLYPEIAERMRKQLDSWSVSVSRSALGADYPEGKVLPSGRKSNPVIEERRRTRMKEWAEEVNASRKNTDSSLPGTLVHYRDFPSTRIPTRPVDVWLPEGYDAASADRYPVIYLHDGQFMFDRSNSPMAGTDWLWDVDKTMTRLIREGEIRPAIVVSVWTNAKKKRSRRAEYMPQKFLTDEIRQRMLREQPVWITRRFEGADHSPRAWRERLHIPLKFLLAAPG